MRWHLQHKLNDIQMLFVHLQGAKDGGDLPEFPESFPEEY